MDFQVWTIKIAGPAGAGIKSGGQLLSKILISHGFFVWDYTEYPSLVRGGHNTFQITFSRSPVYSVRRTVDLFFSIAPNQWQSHQPEFHSKSLIFDDAPPSTLTAGKIVNFPRQQLLTQTGSPKVVNTLFLGLAVYLLNLDSVSSAKALESQYPSDAELNLKAFHLAYEYASLNFNKYKLNPTPNNSFASSMEYLDGNEAFGRGLLRGECDFYAAYPMTPATGTLHFLADKQTEYPITVVHPEDEIAAANMAAGAAFTGARAVTGTSGGGFALMNETISFCGIAEIGMVYYLVSRPGPATGMPTWTAQGDLLHAVYSGHGEFPKIVIAPSDHQDSFDFAWQSLNLAQTLQTPVIVLSDKLISESSTVLNSLKAQKVVVNRSKSLSKYPASYRRYSLKTRDGISPLSYPGNPGGEYLCNSYEHDAAGYSTEDAAMASAMVAKRFKKNQTALTLTPKALFFGDPQASALIISWGSTKGPLLETLRDPALANQFAYLHLRTLWPLDPGLRFIIDNYKQIIVVEANHTSQLTSLIKSQFDFNPSHHILKSDGRPFYPEELTEQLTSLSYPAGLLKVNNNPVKLENKS